MLSEEGREQKPLGPSWSGNANSHYCFQRLKILPGPPWSGDWISPRGRHHFYFDPRAFVEPGDFYGGLGGAVGEELRIHFIHLA